MGPRTGVISSYKGKSVLRSLEVDCSTLVLQPVAYILILLSWLSVVCSYQKIKKNRC